MPLLTLTTDIGQQDFIVGAVKGQLLSAMPNLHITDITHYLPHDNFAHAAYICKNAFTYYPENTIHFVLLNIFESSSTHFVISHYNNQFIICPNNGILSMITEKIPASSVVLPILNANTTLQITQQVAEAILKITQLENLENIGTKGLNIIEKSMMKPAIGTDWMEGQILFIDNFENVVVNITKEEFEKERKGRNYQIIFKRNETVNTLRNNYADVKEGDSLAWFNSAGYLELSINKGKAAELYGLENFNEKMMKRGTNFQNKWFYQIVRIFFK
ncbi:MAG: SAM-dependent chlorinase/fluorinase [Chitinophagaceae bacterium]|nr:SAM-dependent chlorinase/fluorinase [Chitinophagaceae bacterium]MCW5905632.1 SAM-dependent chlorinase/fluorinase [Chitinophagaceae bacterium]